MRKLLSNRNLISRLVALAGLVLDRRPGFGQTLQHRPEVFRTAERGSRMTGSEPRLPRAWRVEDVGCIL